MSEEQATAAPAADKDPKSRPYVPSPGSESTREMREMSRRRREAEEKLQQHLQEAEHLHEEHVKAHQREAQHAHEDQHHDSHHEGERHEGNEPRHGAVGTGSETADLGDPGTKPAE